MGVEEVGDRYYSYILLYYTLYPGICLLRGERCHSRRSVYGRCAAWWKSWCVIPEGVGLKV